MLTNKLTGAGAADKTYIEDVFSTYLYTGNSSSQTINNGIDLAGKGGMVWCKKRDFAQSNIIQDTARGTSVYVCSNNANGNLSITGGITSFNSNGFSVGPDNLSHQDNKYVSWTFRKAPKFFDVVTYTGNGVADRNISHSLGIQPGLIIIKAISVTSNWFVYHRGSGTSSYSGLSLNSNLYGASYNGNETQTTTATTFNLTHIRDEANSLANTSGVNYVAYLFANDETSNGLIVCNKYTGNGSATGPIMSFGWEPQYIMIRNVTSGGNWQIIDSMRGMPVGSADATLQANLNNAESSVEYVSPTATGFQVTSTSSEVNTSGSTYIYMAIRRGPMRTPTDGTKVFAPRAISSGSTTGISLYNTFGTSPYLADDAHFIKSRASTSAWYAESRLIGKTELNTTAAAAEVSDTYIDYSGGNYGQGYSVVPSPTNDQTIAYVLRRAPGFFDVVCYTGTGAARTINHNLGVAPELIIVKSRSAASTQWYVGSSPTGWSSGLLLNSTAATPAWTGTGVFNSTAPTSSVFSLGNGTGVNTSAATYVAYLFASCPGVSKVGSFTGNGSTQTINCGFTNGARFVLIKRTDSTSNWMVWDTARGITTTFDPLLLLNSTAAETSGADQIQPNSTGFTVQYAGPSTDSAPNINGATYIYLAIA